MVWQMSTKYWKSCLISGVYLSPVIHHKPLGCRIKQIGRFRVATIFLHGCRPSWLPSFMAANAILHGYHSLLLTFFIFTLHDYNPSWLLYFMVAIVHCCHPLELPSSWFPSFIIASWLPSFMVAILHGYDPLWLPSSELIAIYNICLSHLKTQQVESQNFLDPVLAKP